MPISRQKYRDECAKRWHGSPFADALSNLDHWQALHDDLLEAMRSYNRNPCMKDLNGKCHAEGTLTDFLWKTQSAWEPDRSRLAPLLDFCDHHQEAFLGRGLIIYCKLLLEEIKATSDPVPGHPEMELFA